MQRLCSLGLTDEMAERVLGQIRAHRTLAEGSSFKLERINLDRWDDLEAAAHFERAVDRRARCMVQENSLGLLAPWMSHLVAQVMLRFPTFVICAHSKQLLHNVHTCGPGEPLGVPRDHLRGLYWAPSAEHAPGYHALRGDVAGSAGRFPIPPKPHPEPRRRGFFDIFYCRCIFPLRANREFSD